MVSGVGIDTVEVARFDTWVDDARKMARFFNSIEIAYVNRLPVQSRASSLAARFAAKEAWGKATGKGLRGVRLVDVAVSNGIDNAPRLLLFHTAAGTTDGTGACRLHLSLTHTREYATACVIVETNDSEHEVRR